MSVKFYQMTWLVLIIAVAAFFFTGNLTPVVGVVFGFVIFGLVFMGMMSVLPASIAHPPQADERLGASFRNRIGSTLERSRRRFGEWRSSWMSSGSIEVRRPKFH